MKRRTLFPITLFFILSLSSCDSTLNKLAECYADIDLSAKLTMKYAVDITDAWYEAEKSYGYENYGMADNFHDFDNDFKRINQETNWTYIGELITGSDKFLHKNFPSKWIGAQRCLLRLYNKGREIRNLAKKITVDSPYNDDYDQFCDDFIDLMDEFHEIQKELERDYPEIPGSLYSIEDILN